MNPQEAYKLTQFLYQQPEYQTTLCWIGPAGCGKTTLIHQLAADLRLPLLHVPCRHSDSDVLGYNMPQNGRPTFTPSEMIQRAIERPALIYLDELNRCSHLARAPLMELINERSVAGIPLHPKTKLIITVNDESAAYDTVESDAAMKTRVIPIPITVDSTYAAAWAAEQGLPAMAAFYTDNPQLLNREGLAWKQPIDMRFTRNIEVAQQLLMRRDAPVDVRHAWDCVIDFAIPGEAGSRFKTAVGANPPEKAVLDVDSLDIMDVLPTLFDITPDKKALAKA